MRTINNMVKKIALWLPPIRRMYEELQLLRLRSVPRQGMKLDLSGLKPAARAFRDAEIAKLRAMPNDKLHLGCGAHPHAGWTNIDNSDGSYFGVPDAKKVVLLDVFDALGQIESGTVSFITSEQFFEHLSRQDALLLMRECFRALKPGGVMRIQVPDLMWTVKLYLDEVPFAKWDAVQYPHRMRNIENSRDPSVALEPGERLLPAMMVNNSFYSDGHKCIYDFPALEQSLRLAGFAEVTPCAFGVSEYPELHGLDCHDGGELGRSWIPKIALIVEATKR